MHAVLLSYFINNIIKSVPTKIIEKYKDGKINYSDTGKMIPKLQGVSVSNVFNIN